MDNSFQDYFIFTIKLPLSKHKGPEVIEAKMKEVKNLEDYKVFKEIEDEGQETIGSRWVITQKEKQKQQTKPRLVARGFQESLKPQSDSTKASKDRFKMLMVVAANSGFKRKLHSCIQRC